MGNIVPSYSFQSPDLPEPTHQPLPGIFQGVHFTIDMEHFDWILSKIENWFQNREEIILVDSGAAAKSGLGYIILEWDGCKIDPLFLAILWDEELVQDYTYYEREEDV